MRYWTMGYVGSSQAALVCIDIYLALITISIQPSLKCLTLLATSYLKHIVHHVDNHKAGECRISLLICLVLEVFFSIYLTSFQ